MAKIYLQKQLIGSIEAWLPADEKAQEVTHKAKYGKVMCADFSFPRNPGNHARFFKFLRVTFDIQDHFDNFKHYRKWIVMKSGNYTIITAPNGCQLFDADSIAWDKMDEEKFREAFSECIDAFLKEWGDRISREELMEVIDFS